MNKTVIIALALWPLVAAGQTPTPVPIPGGPLGGTITGGTISGTDVSGANVTATGSSTPQTLAATAATANAAATQTALSSETTRAQAAEALLAPLASPVFTGNPTVPGYLTTSGAAGTYAPLASPAFSGTPTVPTAAAGTSTTQAASTAFTTGAVATETTRATTAEGLLAPLASPAITGGTISGTDVSGANVTATGGTAAQTEAGRASAHVTVEDFGAKGDCATDDTAAFNAYAAALRASTGYYAYNRSFNLASGRCYVVSSVNWTLLNNVTVNGHGSEVIGNTANVAVVDAVESTQLVIEDLVIGTSASPPPLTGIQIGRALAGGYGAGSITFRNVHVLGSFTEAAFYNREAETSAFYNSIFWNALNSTGMYSVIMDGDNYWPITSLYAGTYNPTCLPSSSAACQDVTHVNGTTTFGSFNEQVFIGGVIQNSYGPAIWMSNYQKHRYYSTYLNAPSTGPGAIIYVGVGTSNGATETPRMLLWDVHSENPASDIQLRGAATPVLQGLTHYNHADTATGSTFSLGSGVTSATIHDLDLHIGTWVNSGATVFDVPANWTVDGSAYTATAGAWNLSSGFSGVLNANGQVAYYGSLASTITLPPTLTASAIANTGSVTALTLSGGGYTFPSGATLAQFPQPTIAAPPSGGQQASAITATMNFGGIYVGTYNSGGTMSPYNGGSGCSVNDVLSLTGGTYTTAGAMKVTGISTGGVVTSLTYNTVGTYTGIPAEPITLTGGHCTVAPTIVDTLWVPRAATVTSGGAGYTTPPAVTYPAGYTGVTPVSATATLGGAALNLAAGGAAINLSSSGVALTGAVSMPSPSLTGALTLPAGSTATTGAAGDTSAAVATDQWVSGGPTNYSAAYQHTYTSSGSWTPPANATLIRIIAVGQGGCGGGGASLTTPFTGAGGGGGGGASMKDTGWFPKSQVSGSATITIGTACTAAAGGTSGGSGGNGGAGANATVAMTGLQGGSISGWGGGGGAGAVGGAGATATGGGGSGGIQAVGGSSTNATGGTAGNSYGAAGGSGTLGTANATYGMGSGGAGCSAAGVATFGNVTINGPTGGSSGGGLNTGAPFSSASNSYQPGGGVVATGGSPGGATGGAGQTGTAGTTQYGGGGGGGGGAGTTTGGNGGTGGALGGGGGGGGSGETGGGGAGGVGGAAQVIVMAE
jgi:hypothetical protein